MRGMRWRALARRGGLPGLLLAGIYVAIRLACSSKRFRRAAVAVIAGVLAAAWIAVIQQGGGVRHSRMPHTQPADAPRYDLVDLGTAGEGVVATGLNARGDVSGIVVLNQREWHAVLWQDGAMRDLGTLGGARSQAMAVNDGGHVAGSSETESRQFLGFCWRQAKMEKLVSLDGRFSSGAAINSRGEVAGLSTDRGDRAVACIWRDGRPTSLGVPDGYFYSVAESLNDRTQAAGYALSQDQERVRAFLWETGKARDLGTLGGESSVALVVGPGGQVGGMSMVSGGTDPSWHACVWEGNTVRDLGKLPDMDWALVSGINRAGDLVGGSGVG